MANRTLTLFQPKNSITSQHTTVLVEEVFSCLPASQIFARFEKDPYSFFLDSGMDRQKLGRYSFMGSQPFLVFKSKGSSVAIIQGSNHQVLRANPFEVLKGLLAEYKLEYRQNLLPFVGGAVGYFSYDLCHFVEELPKTAVDDLSTPDCCLGFYDQVVVFDHLKNKTYLAATGLSKASETEAQAKAELNLGEIKAKVLKDKQDFRENTDAESGPKVNLRSNFTPLPERHGRKSVVTGFTKKQYLEAVKAARDYIIAGDIFQVNLSQRLETDLTTTPFSLYRRLRALNPAPFASYLNFGEVVVIGSSPERFLKLDGGRVQTRPIKGTRPRGRSNREDKTLAKELLLSEKDRAEHIMIVDLERNDLGRVCEYGSVRVSEPTILESYTTVHHLVSTVEGKLFSGKDTIDLLTACFPGGSITGAPKVRAMEIIDELEPTKRSIYTGSIGYVGFNGDMDLNIVIRTFLAKDEKLYFQVGGGVVFDSSPEAEYTETLDKAKALVQALEL